MTKSQNDEKNLQWNIVITILCQIASLVINLISKRAINIFLGIDYLGLQSVYSNFCEVLSFAFMGIGTTMLFSCYGPLAHKDHDKIAAIFQYYDKFYKKTAQIVMAFGICSIFAVVFVTNSDISTKEIIITYSCFMISIVLYNRFLFQNYLVEADEKRYVVAIITNGIDGIALIAQVLCLKYIGNYASFVICILIKNIIIYLIFKIYLNKRYVFLRNSVPEISKNELMEIHKNAKNMIVYRFGTVLITNTDSIFISKLINIVTVGIYSNYSFILIGVESLVAAFYSAITARIGHLIQTTNKERQFQSFISCSFINIWISGFTTVCFYYLVNDFIDIWMGNIEALPNMILIIILINYYVIACRFSTKVFRETTGMFDKIQIVVLVKGVLNIILSYILGKIWGLTGILIATTIASVSTLFWYEAKLVYDYFDKSFFREIGYQFCSIALLILSFCITGFFCSFLSGSGIFHFIIKIIVSVIASNIIYVLFLGVLLLKRKNTIDDIK